MRMTEEFMKTTNEKDARLKESLFCNAQLKNEVRNQALKIKDLDCEISKLRNDIEMERSKRSEIENSVRNDSLLKQAYDKAS